METANEVQLDHVGYVFDPTTGKKIAETDIDKLAEAYKRIKREIDGLNCAKLQIAQAVALRCPREARTERVVGSQYTFKVEWPAKFDYNAGTLKVLWDKYSDIAKQYLRISLISVQSREVDKLSRSVGDEQLEAFKRDLESAKVESTSSPYVTIEVKKPA